MHLTQNILFDRMVGDDWRWGRPGARSEWPEIALNLGEGFDLLLPSTLRRRGSRPSRSRAFPRWWFSIGWLAAGLYRALGSFTNRARGHFSNELIATPIDQHSRSADRQGHLSPEASL